jgi:hypothetical protein
VQIHYVNNPRRRHCTTFCKHIVAENHYGCVQNLGRKQFRGQRSRQLRRVETRGDGRGGRGEENTLSDSGFKDGLDKKTVRTEEETRHEDFVQIHDVNNPRRRHFTTFCKHIVAENHYGCVQNVVRKQFLGQRSGQLRRVEKRGDGQGGRGEENPLSDSGFKDGLGHDKKTGRTEEETRHEDFVQIQDVNNPQEKAVYNIFASI